MNCPDVMEPSTKFPLQLMPAQGGNPVFPCSQADSSTTELQPLMALMREQINRIHEEVSARAVLEERHRLARELHDSVAQALYGIGLGAQTALTWLEKDPSRLAEPLQYISALADTGMAEIRALIFDLRPDSLEREGLIAAIEKQATALRGRYRIAVEVTHGAEPNVALPVKEALLRIAQEAMHNAVKHANASTIRVKIDCRRSAIKLEIADDGSGFDPSASFPGHLGLISMAERAQRLGGDVEIVSAPGNGTRVLARIPLVTR